MENGRFRFFSDTQALIYVAGGVTLLLLVGLVAWMGIGSPPDTEGLNFRERDWVLVADFENHTGEAAFDGVLEYALQREIINSKFVNVVPLERIQDTLQLMRRPLDTRIDPEVAREISLRDGNIKALLTGRVEKLDSTYLLSLQVLDPGQGYAIATASEEAVGQKEVLSALRSLSNWARENLGEKLALIQENAPKLEKVSTSSLRAVRLYTEARPLFDRFRFGPAEELLRQAIEIDPEFASAHIWLAWTLKNQQESFEEYIPHAAKAVQLVGTTSEQERYFIYGSHYWMKGDPDSAIHTFEALLSLYPDHFWANRKLIELYRQSGQEREALRYRLRLADLRPNSFRYSAEAASYLVAEGDLAEAEPYLNRAQEMITAETISSPLVAFVTLHPAYRAWLRGDVQTALVEAKRASERLKSLGLERPHAVGNFYITVGRLELAREWFEKMDWTTGRHYFLAGAAYASGDTKALNEHLNRFLKVPELAEGSYPSNLRFSRDAVVIMLARSGLLSEAAKLLPSDQWIRETFGRESAREAAVAGAATARGVLALSRGRIPEGAEMIEEALTLLRSFSSNVYFLGSEILADAYRQQGNLEKAVRVLEKASNDRSFISNPGSLKGPIWLKVQAQLAVLYREMGRDEESRKITAELRKLLASADPDHPTLRQLDGTKKLASLESTK